MAILWAVYRQDFSGNRTTVGMDGVFRTQKGEEIKVWDLESEEEANEACRRIAASHYHHHKADYYPVDYVDGEMMDAFKKWRIEIM